MTDLALDPVTRDLILPIRPVTGAERVAQSVGIRLRAWLGEWFLDLNHGVPYIQQIMGKGVRPEIVEAILRAQILDVRGVKSIKTFNIEINNQTRSAAVRFEVVSAEGLAAGSLTIRG